MTRGFQILQLCSIKLQWLGLMCDVIVSQYLTATIEASDEIYTTITAFNYLFVYTIDLDNPLKNFVLSEGQRMDERTSNQLQDASCRCSLDDRQQCKLQQKLEDKGYFEQNKENCTP